VEVQALSTALLAFCRRLSQRNKSIRVLFIGNSFTQRNDLPFLIASLAAQRGLGLKHQLISAGGASLKRHWNAGTAVSAIRSGSYDFVVLQEQSTLPVKNAARMADSIRLFDAEIKQDGAKTALFMTWAREHSPQHQPVIADAYNSIGQEIGAVVVPVGLAWQRFISKHDSSLLYDADQSHPSLAGSYLAACVFITTLLKASPVGLGELPPELDVQLAAEIQRSVWKQLG
jgi:hypothetical protein